MGRTGTLLVHAAAGGGTDTWPIAAIWRSASHDREIVKWGEIAREAGAQVDS